MTTRTTYEHPITDPSKLSPELLQILRSVSEDPAEQAMYITYANLMSVRTVEEFLAIPCTITWPLTYAGGNIPPEVTNADTQGAAYRLKLAWDKLKLEEEQRKLREGRLMPAGDPKPRPTPKLTIEDGVYYADLERRADLAQRGLWAPQVEEQVPEFGPPRPGTEQWTPALRNFFEHICRGARSDDIHEWLIEMPRSLSCLYHMWLSEGLDMEAELMRRCIRGLTEIDRYGSLSSASSPAPRMPSLPEAYKVAEAENAEGRKEGLHSAGILAYLKSLPPLSHPSPEEVVAALADKRVLCIEDLIYTFLPRDPEERALAEGLQEAWHHHLSSAHVEQLRMIASYHYFLRWLGGPDKL